MAERRILIQSNDADGATSFRDSFEGVTLTSSGSVAHETSTKLFGASSIYFDNGNIFISDLTDLGFSDNDFNIDFQWKPTVLPSKVFAQYSAVSTENVCIMTCSAGGQMTCYFYTDIGTVTLVSAVGAVSVASGLFHHVRVYRVGDRWGMKIKGVQDGSEVTNSGTVNTPVNTFRLGSYSGSTTDALDGYIEEFHIHIADGTFDEGIDYSTAAVPTEPYLSLTPGMGTDFPIFEAGASGYFGFSASIGANFPVFSASFTGGASIGATFPIFSAGFVGEVHSVNSIGANFPVFTAALSGENPLTCQINGNFPMISGEIEAISQSGGDIGATFPVFSARMLGMIGGIYIGADFPVFEAMIAADHDIFANYILSYQR